MGDLHRLIAFDLDGTLVDSRRDLADAANALIVEHGGSPLPEEAIGRMVGEGTRVLVERALTAAGAAVPASLGRFLELYDERLLKTTRAYEGIPDVLRRLVADRFLLAVLTNKPAAPSARIIEELGLAAFITTTIGGDSRFPKKPDPSALQHLMRTHGVVAERTVMVGDSWIDEETAQRAGTRLCLARYGFGFANFPADRLFHDAILVDQPAQIPGAIGRLLHDAGSD